MDMVVAAREAVPASPGERQDLTVVVTVAVDEAVVVVAAVGAGKEPLRRGSGVR